MTFAEARLTDAVLGVREEYLDTAAARSTTNTARLAKYLGAIGVTENQLRRLRANLL